MTSDAQENSPVQSDTNTSTAQCPPESESEVETHLNELDNTTENKRRSIIILTTVCVLLAASILVIILMPPLSWTPQKETHSNFQTTASVSQVIPGEAQLIDLSYSEIADKAVFDINLEQISEYEGNIQSRVTLKAECHFERQTTGASKGALGIKLENVDAHVYENSQEVKIPSAGGMLAGIYLYSYLKPKEGMTSIVPDADINPQAARVLYIVVDSLHQIWLPMPEEQIGLHGKWHLSDPEQAEFRRQTEVEITQQQSEQVMLTSRTDLYQKKGGQDQSIGQGKGQITMKSGQIERGEIEFEREQQIWEKGAGKQKVHVTVMRKEKQEESK